MRPPTNSLPPLLCPWPTGLAGDTGLFGEYGESGGLRSVDALGSSGSAAPGLNEKLGNATGLRVFSEPDGRSSGDLSDVSMVDIGRRPDAREKDGGAEEGESIRAGKTNGGLGGGWATS